MSEQGWAGFLAEHHEQETASERAVRLARQAERRDDQAAELNEAERAAALAERHELLQVAALQAGVAGRSAAEIFADAGRIGDEDAQYEAARAIIERIERRRAARQRDAVEQAQRMAEVTGLASRSAPTVTGGPDLLAGAKQAHREFVQATRAAQAAAAGTPRRERPFAASRGSVARSELECWHCVNDNVSHEDSVLLHSDPQWNVPVTTVEQAAQAEHAEHAERRRYASHAEISR